MCAPNDVWSLGVILVNLTCGRNPWKQASLQDSTYRAFARSPDFLKTILPITDELNDILSRIFTAAPEQRITMPELRERILACPRLTANPLAAMPPSPPATPEHISPYVAPEEAILDYDDSPLSPTSTISDDGSLTSSVSTLSDFDEEFIQEQQDYPAPQFFEPEAPRDFFPGQDFIPQHYTGPVPVHAPVPQPPSKPAFTPFWGVVHKYVQPAVRQPHVPFHGQVLPSFQGCF